MKRYRTAEAFRQALGDQLARRADELAVPLEVLRRRLVFHRFLARLLRVAPDRWVLTGGVALDWRLARLADFQRARTTVDLDFLYRASQEQARADLQGATRLDLDDYFNFVVTETGDAIDEARSSTRYHLTAHVGRKPYLRLAVDVGLIDPLRWDPDDLPASVALEDLGFGELTVPSLRLPHLIAEKVHALTRTLRDGTRRTRSVKDLVDLILISKAERPLFNEVRTALQAVFAAYDSHRLPSKLPPTPEVWGRDYVELAQEMGLPRDFTAADVMAGEFLNDVLAGNARGVWDPVGRRWDRITDSSKPGTA